MKKIKRNAFTIFEVLLSTVVIGFIAMLLTSSLVSTQNKETLEAALNKNTTFLNQVYQSIPMLQMQGKIAPGAITANLFMQAVMLTTKCIDVAPNGVALTNNTKFNTYIYNNPPQVGINSYTSFVQNSNNNTIILKNNVIISIEDNTTIIVDVNGRKSPNTLGSDIYKFTVNNTQLVLQ